MTIYVDNTHLGRHVTGLERITLELFSEAALAPLDVVPVRAQGLRQMVTTQTLGLPMRLAASSSILLCPGFPPSPLLRPFASRVLPYIHDDFLITRRAELNMRARLYMAGPFKFALRHFPRFLANSGDTRRKLAAHCRPDAEVTLYRPSVRNVFGLDPGQRGDSDETGRGGARAFRATQCCVAGWLGDNVRCSDRSETVGSDDRGHRARRTEGGGMAGRSYRDVYRIDVATGKREKVVTKVPFGASLSPEPTGATMKRALRIS